MHPGGFPLFLEVQDDGDLPELGRLVEKLRLKMFSSSWLALGSRALRNIWGVFSNSRAPLMRIHVLPDQDFFSRSARNSSQFLWRSSSDSLRVVAQASR